MAKEEMIPILKKLAHLKLAICGNLVPLISGAPPDFRGNAPGIRGRLCLILRFKL